MSLHRVVDPSGEQARTWLRDELAKPEYSDQRSPLERLIGWIITLLDELFGGGGGDASAPSALLGVVIALALVAGLVILLARLRADPLSRTKGSAVLGDTALTAEQFRAAADQALADGRFGAAVLGYIRALARESADRTLLHDAPSLTAHEIGDQLAVVFPNEAQQVRSVVNLFDSVAYGGARATRDDAEQARDTEAAVRSARPAREGAIPTGVGPL